MASPETMRLQKYLSRAGVASRRTAEDLIVEGRVQVDGRTVRELGTRVDPETAVVTVDGRHVELARPRWLALHKPPGCLCSRGDPRGRPTVYDLLPAEEVGLFHVGRLDYMSEGLVLLTNEGEVAHRLLHPAAAVAREYRVTLAAPPPLEIVRRLQTGIELEDGLARAEGVTLEATTRRGASVGREVEVRLTLREGRNRQIRRMLSAVDAELHALRRIGFGPIELGTLARGEWRELSRGEITALRRCAGMGET